MSLRDQIAAVLAQAREAGGNVIAIEAVQGVLDCYEEQGELADRVLQRMHDGREAA